MAAIAVFGVNITVVRAYLLGEQAGQLILFDFAFLIFFALQLGLWRYLSTSGRLRRFWLGFEFSAVVATVALLMLFLTEVDLIDWYTEYASDLAYLCLPARVDALLTHEHWDWFLAIIFFLPELIIAALGGTLAACLFRPRAALDEPSVIGVGGTG
jgi:hypothetical protein